MNGVERQSPQHAIAMQRTLQNLLALYPPDADGCTNSSTSVKIEGLRMASTQARDIPNVGLRKIVHLTHTSRCHERQHPAVRIRLLLMISQAGLPQ